MWMRLYNTHTNTNTPTHQHQHTHTPTYTQEVQLDKLLLFVLHTIARLVDLTPSLTVLQLYLMAAHAASEVAKLELIAYECYEQV